MRPDPRGRDEIVASGELITYTIVLGAAVFIYIHWRTVGGRLAAWLGVGLILTATDGMLQSGLLAGTESSPANGWVQLSHIGLCLSLAAIAWAAEHTDVVRPGGLVVAVGTFALVVTLSLFAVNAESLSLTKGETAVLDALVLLSGLVVVMIVLQLPRIALWVRQRLAFAGLALLVGSQAQAHLESETLGAVVAVSAYAIGAVMLMSTALAMFRGATLEQANELSSVNHVLEEFRAEAQFERERLHEINSTIAGIASASRILRHDEGLTVQCRRRLEEMLEAEASRLERLISAGAPATGGLFDIDDTVSQLVVSHRSRGLEVRWTPGGRMAAGRSDDVAEVVNILLANAAEHGRGAVATLEVDSDANFLQITCSDGGPGVSAEVRDQLFDTGVRGPDSAGQGLGLAIAHRLATQSGGSLELRESEGSGAVFVARFPQLAVSHGSLDHAAQ